VSFLLIKQLSFNVFIENHGKIKALAPFVFTLHGASRAFLTSQ